MGRRVNSTGMTERAGVTGCQYTATKTADMSGPYIIRGANMLEIQIEIQALEALLDHLSTVERSPVLDFAYKTLQDAHTNAAEEYWTEKWGGL